MSAAQRSPARSKREMHPEADGATGGAAAFASSLLPLPNAPSAQLSVAVPSAEDGSSSSDVPSPLRCRGGGATSPAETGSPEQVANELQVAAEIQRLLRQTRKRKLEIVERDCAEQLDAAWLGTEQTSWERERAPSPSSWMPAADSEEEGVEGDEQESGEAARPTPDVSDPMASLPPPSPPSDQPHKVRATASACRDDV